MRKLLFLCGFSFLFMNETSAQSFYDPATIQTIEIYFAQSNWDALLDNLASTTEDYLIADSVRINGVVFDSVGVKYKGNSSYNANNNKNPIHIELNHVHDNYDYEGYTDVKLQNGYQDPSMIREVLSYAILEQYMDCPKSNFANVYINGILRGLYSNAESINDKFNGEHYFSTDGSFFKCNPIGGAGPGGGGNPDLSYLGADSSLYSTRYELKSDYGWNDLVDLTYTLNNDFSNLDSKLDIDRALWMLAFNNVLVNLDSYSGAFRQNYYLYKDVNDRFVSTIWDLNMSFAGFPGGTGSGSYTAATLDPFSNSSSSIHPLIVKLLGDPMYKRMYMAHLRTIVQESFESDYFLTLANQYRTTIDAAVQADPYKFYTYTQFQNSLTTGVTGGGPGGSTIPGIEALMDSRVSFFNMNANYSYTAPVISSVTPSELTPDYGQTITISANVSNTSTVYLGYRLEHQLRFNRIQMYDDGLHGDGSAGDQVYGVSIILNGIELEYYIYAENTNAGKFSPQRAEYEFYSLSITLPLAAAGNIFINELMADNSNTATDYYGESNDWIELYNSSNTAVDISNLFLTDDPLNYSKWGFPAGTAIPANDVLIIWADEDSSQLGLHANFKLSATGESIILSDGVNYLDFVDFEEQTTDVSYARCPDGGTFIYGTPTFDRLNNCFVGIKEMETSQFLLYPNPTNGNINLVIPETTSGTLHVFDMTGRSVFTGNFSDQLNYEIPSQNWDAGFYNLSIESGGTSKSFSFIKN